MLQPMNNTPIIIYEKHVVKSNKLLESLALIRNLCLTGAAVLTFAEVCREYNKRKQEESKGE